MNHSNGLVVKKNPSSQWVNRAELNYFKTVSVKITELQKWLHHRTILDVGAGDSMLLKEVERNFECTYAIDVEQCPSSAKVNCMADFLQWKKSTFFDCVICLQVLEHLEDPAVFLKALLDSVDRGGSLIVTVPYLWGKGVEPQHVQDPIDLAKFVSWLPPGIVPDELRIINEESNPFRRLMAVFHRNLDDHSKFSEITEKLPLS